MSENRKTKLCKYCKTEIPSGAKICPNCQKKQGGIVKWVVIALIVIVIGASASMSNNSDEDKQTASTSENTKTSSESSSVDDKSKTSNTDKEKQHSNDATPEPKSDDVKKEKSIPAEYKSALNSAETYANMMNMSKAAIYDQLISDYGNKFTKKQAQYAVDHLK